MADCDALEGIEELQQQQESADARPAPIADMATAPPEYTAYSSSCSDHSVTTALLADCYDCEGEQKQQQQPINAASNAPPAPVPKMVSVPPARNVCACTCICSDGRNSSADADLEDGGCGCCYCFPSCLRLFVPIVIGGGFLYGMSCLLANPREVRSNTFEWRYAWAGVYAGLLTCGRLVWALSKVPNGLERRRARAKRRGGWWNALSNWIPYGVGTVVGFVISHKILGTDG